jgi:DNA-binding response OmpR family regulator
VDDDDPKLGDLLTSALGEEGHVVNVAATAAAGLAELRNHEPDVVLLDVMLPDQDGLEVCRAFAQAGPVDSDLAVDSARRHIGCH